MRKPNALFGSILAIALLPYTAAADDDDDDGDQIQEPLIELAVDCAGGDSINEAIALAPGFPRFTVVIRGQCAEEVFIPTDNVTLTGDSLLGGQVTGQITVDAARNVRIEDLTISSGDTGVRIRNGAHVQISDTTIEDMDGHGVFVLDNAIGIIDDVSVAGTVLNCIFGSNGAVLDLRVMSIRDCEFGLVLQNGSSARVRSVDISDIVEDGISVNKGASVDVQDSSIARAKSGMFVEESSSAEIRNVTISEVADLGIASFNSASVDIRNSIIRDAEFGVDVNFSGSMRLEDSFIEDIGSHAIFVSNGASAQVEGNTISGSGDNAVDITDGGYARLRGNTVTSLDPGPSVLFVDSAEVRLQGGNVLSGANEFASVEVRNGSALVQFTSQTADADRISGGLSISSQSFARFSNAEVNGDAFVERHSELNLRGAGPGDVNVSGSVNIEADALLHFSFAGARVLGDVNCRDDESSLLDRSAATVIEGSVDCSGFE